MARGPGRRVGCAFDPREYSQSGLELSRCGCRKDSSSCGGLDTGRVPAVERQKASKNDRGGGT